MELEGKCQNVESNVISHTESMQYFRSGA